MIFTIMILDIIDLIGTLSLKDTKAYGLSVIKISVAFSLSYAERHYPEFHCGECHYP
jgi:hypothetical protein